MNAVVGIDIGGTAIKFGLVTPDGTVISRLTLDTPAEEMPPASVNRIAEGVRRLGAQDSGAATSPRGFTRIGVGCAGLVSMDSGVLHTSPNLPKWTDVPLARLLENELRTPVSVLNDANAFALAEARVGAGRGMDPVVGLTLGTGVGGGIVIGGQIYGGCHGFAGEIGHTTIDYNGPPCACGNRGCLELMVGRRPILNDYASRAEWTRGSVAHDLVGGRREDLTPETIARAAERGDPAARACWEAAGVALGSALATFVNLFDPEIIVIGGGIALAGELIFEPARRVMRERAMSAPADQPPVVPATLGTDAGLIGAALYAMSEEGAGEGAR